MSLWTADRIRRFRDHAAKMREIAAEVTSPETRLLLEAAACDWEKMADFAEQQSAPAIAAHGHDAGKASGRGK